MERSSLHIFLLWQYMIIRSVNCPFSAISSHSQPNMSSASFIFVFSTICFMFGRTGLVCIKTTFFIARLSAVAFLTDRLAVAVIAIRGVSCLRRLRSSPRFAYNFRNAAVFPEDWPLCNKRRVEKFQTCLQQQKYGAHCQCLLYLLEHGCCKAGTRISFICPSVSNEPKVE